MGVNLRLHPMIGMLLYLIIGTALHIGYTFEILLAPMLYPLVILIFIFGFPLVFIDWERLEEKEEELFLVPLKVKHRYIREVIN